MSFASSLASVMPNGGSAPKTAAIAAFDPTTGNEASLRNDTKGNSLFQAFQFFPEKLSDTKGVHYAEKTVPGASHPMYTFISGGERSISFDAIFVNDETSEENDSISGFLTGKANFSFTTTKRKDVVNIAEAVGFLRSFLYPIYKQQISSPPLLAVVYFPMIGFFATDGTANSFIGIMTRCDVIYEAFHRDGTPRIATIGLEFKEVVQTSKTWKYVNGMDVKQDYTREIVL